MTGTITTVAGNYASGGGYSGDGGPATSAQLNNPTRIKFDASNNLYITDYSNNVIREVLASDGTIRTVSPRSPTRFATGSPNNFAVDSSKVFIFRI